MCVCVRLCGVVWCAGKLGRVREALEGGEGAPTKAAPRELRAQPGPTPAGRHARAAAAAPRSRHCKRPPARGRGDVACTGDSAGPGAQAMEPPHHEACPHGQSWQTLSTIHDTPLVLDHVLPPPPPPLPSVTSQHLQLFTPLQPFATSHCLPSPPPPLPLSVWHDLSTPPPPTPPPSKTHKTATNSSQQQRTHPRLRPAAACCSLPLPRPPGWCPLPQPLHTQHSNMNSAACTQQHKHRNTQRA